MKIRVTHEITDQQRLTIAIAAGERGLADREMLEDWINSVVEATTIQLDETFIEATNLILKKLNI